MQKFPAIENPPKCLLGRKITFCSFRLLSFLFVNTQASLLTLPTQDQYQYFVTSEVLSSLWHVNRYDKGVT